MRVADEAFIYQVWTIFRERCFHVLPGVRVCLRDRLPSQLFERARLDLRGVEPHLNRFTGCQYFRYQGQCAAEYQGKGKDNDKQTHCIFRVPPHSPPPQRSSFPKTTPEATQIVAPETGGSTARAIPFFTRAST